MATPGALFTIRYPTRDARKIIEGQAARTPHRWGQMLDRSAAVYLEELRVRTPESQGGEEPGGRLRSGWRVRRVIAGSRAARGIYNTEGYLRFVLRGRGPIDQIASGRTYPDPETGRRRGALRFWVDGREVYRWRVGPSAANPFHLEAIRAARARVRKEMREAGIAIIRGK